MGDRRAIGSRRVGHPVISSRSFQTGMRRRGQRTSSLRWRQAVAAPRGGFVSAPLAKAGKPRLHFVLAALRVRRSGSARQARGGDIAARWSLPWEVGLVFRRAEAAVLMKSRWRCSQAAVVWPRCCDWPRRHSRAPSGFAGTGHKAEGATHVQFALATSCRRPEGRVCFRPAREGREARGGDIAARWSLPWERRIGLPQG
jgi:hypothetical protein